VAELFPEIVKPSLDKNDDLPSCSAVEALERQEPFINQTLAFHALALLARLFRHRYEMDEMYKSKNANSIFGAPSFPEY